MMDRLFMVSKSLLPDTTLLRMSDNPYLLDNDSALGVAKSAGLALMSAATDIQAVDPDVVVLLGDRFEILAAAQAAHLLGIPIAHLHGGETSSGSKDDAMRNAITMLATYHFASSSFHAWKLRQMKRENVFTVGAIGVDNALRVDSVPTLSYPIILVSVPEGEGLPEILNALSSFKGYEVVVIGPNSDEGRSSLTPYQTVSRLSPSTYLSYLKAADVAVGSSSSLLIEAHVLGTPTVIVGTRQAGRQHQASCIHVPVDEVAIHAAVLDALNHKTDHLLKMPSVFGDGDAAERVVAKLCEL